VPDDFGADLDQPVAQRGQQPVLGFLRQRPDAGNLARLNPGSPGQTSAVLISLPPHSPSRRPLAAGPIEGLPKRAVDPEFRQGSKAARAAAVLNGYCANNATHDRSFNNATQPKP
jgi:hypothetical protein